MTASRKPADSAEQGAIEPVSQGAQGARERREPASQQASEPPSEVMMSTLEVEVDDLEALFKLLDDGSHCMLGDKTSTILQKGGGAGSCPCVPMTSHIFGRITL